MNGDFPDGPVVKTSPSNAGVEGLIPSLVKRIASWKLPEKAVALTPALLPGKSHGRRSLVGCSPWVGKDSDAGRDWGQEEKGTTEDEMAGWHH